MNSSDVFMLEELLVRLQNDDEIIRIIITQFISDTPRQISDMQVSAARDDHESVRILAHTLKGAAATVAGKELSMLAATVEQAAKNGKLEHAGEHLRVLPAAFDRFTREVIRFGFYPGE
ncbi:MAG: Hpt domain-containing protein [Chlorobi bacterium]|nr:Hpt domain-containing protein [Chlorobiota bacterium]